MSVICELSDLRRLYHKRVPKMFQGYCESGSWTQQTLAMNDSDFNKILFRQRVARDLAPRSLATQMVGQDVSMPVAMAPVGLLGGPALLVTILKNTAHPLAVFLLGSWLGLEMLWLSVATMLAAMPTGMNMYLFANRYQVSPPTATTSIFVSTVSSVITISIVIALLKSV